MRNDDQIIRLSDFKPRAAPIRKIIAMDSLLVARIFTEQRTMRLANQIPSWECFASTEHWRQVAALLDGRECRKYQAWWTLIYSLCRDSKDGATVACACAYLVKEKMRRSYSKELTVKPERWRLTPEEAGKIREYVLTHYESLNPS